MEKPNPRVLGVLAPVITLVILLPTFALASPLGIYAYPNANQGRSMQVQDQLECHQWAVSQTGFDPNVVQYGHAPPPVPAYGYRPPHHGAGFSIWGRAACSRAVGFSVTLPPARRLAQRAEQ